MSAARRVVPPIVRLRTRDGRTHYARRGHSLCGVSIDSAHETSDAAPASCRRCRARVVDVISDARQLRLLPDCYACASNDPSASHACGAWP